MTGSAASEWSRRARATAIDRARGLTEEQWAWWGLAAAMAVSAALLMWQGRHITFQADELTYFQYVHSFNLRDLLQPQNAHLILIPHFIYAAIFQTVGPVHAVFEVVNVLGVFLCAGLFFLLARRRVAALIALALTIPLLFLAPR